MLDWDHETAEPFPGAPRYFLRVWNPPGAGTQQVADASDFFGGALKGSVAVFTPSVPEGGLRIIGFSLVSPSAEDRSLDHDRFRSAGFFPAVNYSVMCPEGEYGSVPLAEVQEISREEFVAALAAIEEGARAT